MAEDEVDFSKLSLEDRCSHKNFKARISAYEDLIRIFKRIDDEKSPDWAKYTPMVKTIPADPHAAAQEKGLEALFCFVQNSSLAGRMVNDTVSGIINKCLTSTRVRIKELSQSIILMYVEIEKCDNVQDELLKGMDLKNPKVVAATISVFIQIIREFGAKMFKAKVVCKKLTALIEDRDKNIREETKKLILELWHWVGSPMRQDLSNLKAPLLAELEAEYAKISGTKPHAPRLLRSQQARRDQGELVEEDTGAEEGNPVEDIVPDIDPYDLLQPEEILSKIPKDFYEKVEAKKWQERKEVLDAVETLTSKYQKLEPGDYSDLVRALRRVITKDSNVMIVAVAIKCITGLANGLKKKFSPFAPSMLQALLDKFKEKKGNVVTALREAADASYLCTSLESIAEDAVTALQNKNPAIKTETTLFLGRAFSKTPNKTFTDKKFMKPFITVLLSNLNEPDPGVRDAAAEALGVAYKAMGERAINPLLADVEPMKLQKIKDFAEKAVVIAPKAEPKPKPKPKEAKEAPAKTSNAATVKKGPTIKKGPGAGTKKVTKPTGPDANCNYGTEDDSNRNSSTKCEDPVVVNPNVRIDLTTKLEDGLIEKLADKNWKTREEALDKLSQIVLKYPKITPYLGDLSNAICLRLQDSNRNLGATAFIILQNLAGSLGPNCKQHLRPFLPNILSGLSETRANVRSTVLACLNSWADNTSVEEFFQGEMMAEALKQPSPVLRTELYNWLSVRMLSMKNANKDDMASCLPLLFAAIEDRNVDVRKAGNECLLGFMMHMGYDKMNYQALRLKPASKVAVLALLDKVRSQLPAKAPAIKGKGVAGSGKGKAAVGQKAVSPNTSESPEEIVTKDQNDMLLSPSFGSAETLVISPVIAEENEALNIVTTEIPLPKSARCERDIMEIPSEYRIDFQGIANKYAYCANHPMTPLNLLDTDCDFVDEPIVIPAMMSAASDKANGEQLPRRASESVDMMIIQVASPELRKSMEALVQLESVISDPTVSHVMLTRIDQLLTCICIQLRKVLPGFETTDVHQVTDTDKLFRCIVHCLQTIYRQVELPRKASMDSIKDLIYMCLLTLVDPTLCNMQSYEVILRYFNVLVVRIIERSDLNRAICGCMRLMTDALNMPHFNRIVELSTKCQWKALKQLTVYLEEKTPYEFDIGGYVTEFHIFLRTHPFSTWKHREYLPLKTMKTVMHNIVSRLGPGNVYNIVREKDFLRDSEAGNYLRKLIDRELDKVCP